MKKNAFYYTLDIAGDTISAVCLEVNHGLGKTISVSCQSGPAAGIKDGVISELGLLSGAIDGVLNKLSLATGNKIKPLYVSMRWPYVKATHSSAVMPISGRSAKVITSADINLVNQQAYSLGLTIEERVLQQVIQGYTIDNQTRLLNPLGLYGHKLEVDLLLVSALNRDVENLVAAVERSGYRVKAVLLAPWAASLAVLPEDVKMKGCCFLDFGFDSSQMLIFKDGLLRGLESFGFGSCDLTRAIASELRIPFDSAQEVKLSYGNALSASVNPETEILLKKDRDYRPVKRKAICAVIEKQLEGNFSVIRERFLSYHKDRQAPMEIIARGKDVALEGFLERLEADFGLPAHLAKFRDTAAGDLSYAACVGSAIYAISQYPRINLFRLSSYGNILQKILYKSKELYQEYF